MCVCTSLFLFILVYRCLFVSLLFFIIVMKQHNFHSLWSMFPFKANTKTSISGISSSQSWRGKREGILRGKACLSKRIENRIEVHVHVTSPSLDENHSFLSLWKRRLQLTLELFLMIIFSQREWRLLHCCSLIIVMDGRQNSRTYSWERGKTMIIIISRSKRQKLRE